MNSPSRTENLMHINTNSYKHIKDNIAIPILNIYSPQPTFHILIATNGRPSIRNLLDSLEDELLYEDAITIVFDGPEAYARSGYSSGWVSSHVCNVNVFVEPENTGVWGHKIRNKYVSILQQKTTFIMNADDDDVYINGAFSKLRRSCVDKNTLYIAKMTYENNTSLVIPRQNNHIIKNDIGNPNGIIPFDLANKGVWGYTYTGDYEYYTSLSPHTPSIKFIDDVIYLVRHTKDS